ncbi:IS3 family transposase [Ramlibacter rhizophilus]|uniref:IS3 family transposase n=1 Tax=Ramlibacter rhizophilus TaxID=1781167 RepID=UPI003B83472D
MSKSRPPYPAEFRPQIVELARAGKTPAELSREFGPTAQSISNWIAQDARDRGIALPGKEGLTSAEREELARLRRQVRQLQTERDILGKGYGLVRRQKREYVHAVYELVSASQADAKRAGVQTCCRVLGVSASGYYDWLRRRPSARAVANVVLMEAIRQVHKDSDETYGMPRVRAELRDAGHSVSRKRVARLTREGRIRGVSRRRGYVVTTERNLRQRPAPDLVNRLFRADARDQLWVADMTYVPTWSGFLYLAVVLDAYSRKVVGWSMGEQMTADLVIAALNMALHTRRPESVIHHSDQGSQYTSVAFGSRCREMGVRPSMGTVGDAYDNAMAESFFATLECELLDRRSWKTKAEARTALFTWIEGWYNPRRRHSALEYLSPMAFEEKHGTDNNRAREHGLNHCVGRFVASADRRRG